MFSSREDLNKNLNKNAKKRGLSWNWWSKEPIELGPLKSKSGGDPLLSDDSLGYHLMEDEKTTSTSSESIITRRLKAIKKTLEPSFLKSLYPEGWMSRQFLYDVLMLVTNVGVIPAIFYLNSLMLKYGALFNTEEESFNSDFVNASGAVINATCQNLTSVYLYHPRQGCEYQLNKTATPQNISDLCAGSIKTMCRYIDEENICKGGMVLLIVGIIMSDYFYAQSRLDKEKRLAIGLAPDDVLFLEGQDIRSSKDDVFQRRLDFLGQIDSLLESKSTIFPAIQDRVVEVVEKEKVVAAPRNPKT